VQLFSGPSPTVSDSRLPFSSPPTTRRATVEVLDSASTRNISTDYFKMDILNYLHVYANGNLFSGNINIVKLWRYRCDNERIKIYRFSMSCDMNPVRSHHVTVNTFFHNMKNNIHDKVISTVSSRYHLVQN
jgi:hypothetical protein